MGLEFGNIRKRGRVAANLPIPLDVRPLAAEQVLAASQREEGIKAGAIERLSSRHHSIAKAIAAGAKTSEVAAQFGLTPSRVSVLKADGTFNDLIEFYRAKGDMIFEMVHERMAGVSFDSLEELSARLTDPDIVGEIETETLLKIVQVLADRTGHAPKRVEEKNINVNFGDRLEAARARAREMTPMIESTVEEIENV
jgi:hypothetical protein